MQVTFYSILTAPLFSCQYLIYLYAFQLAAAIDVHACRQGSQPREPTTLEKRRPHTPDLHAAPDSHILAFVDRLQGLFPLFPIVNVIYNLINIQNSWWIRLATVYLGHQYC